jgi:hypothetical protein
MRRGGSLLACSKRVGESGIALFRAGTRDAEMSSGRTCVCGVAYHGRRQAGQLLMADDVRASRTILIIADHTGRNTDHR